MSKNKVNVGGQAVVEGVMMRAPRSVATAVRRPDGVIVVEKEVVVPIGERFPIVKLPIIRGAVAILTSLPVGTKALFFSVRAAAWSGGSEQEEQERGGESEKKDAKETSKVILALSMIAALSFNICLFFLLPLYVTKALTPIIGTNNIIFNLVDGGVRIGVLLAYVVAIAWMEDIQRVFQYHGAEHKVIFAHEAGEELTVKNVRKYSRLHPRCGTSFMLIVMIVAVVIFALIPQDVTYKAVIRILLLPVIAGVAYEVLKFTFNYENHPLVKILTAPGLALQKLTTLEPDNSQIEVAIVAMKEALSVNSMSEKSF